MRSMDAFHTNTWGTEMHVVAGRDVVEINCYPLGGVAKGQIVTKFWNPPDKDLDEVGQGGV